jgi:hypothetical protein
VVEKNATERDKGKIDIAADAASLAAGGMGMDFEAAEVGRCGSSAQATCGM